MFDHPARPVHRSRRVLLAAVLVLTVGLAACGSDDTADKPSGSTSTTTTTKPEKGTTGADFADRTFVSKLVKGRDLVPGSQITLTFADDRLGVSGGCNTMSAPYAFAKDTLRWTEAAMSTQMGCEPAATEQDQWLSTLFTDGVGAQLKGDILTLMDRGVVVTLEDKESAQPDKELVGPTWTLESTQDGDTASSLPAGAEPPTITFTADGSVAVFTGCNRGSGGYQASSDGTSIDFGMLAITKMACKDPGAGLESAVLAVLDGTVSMAIQGDQLTLGKGDQGLVYRAA